MTETNNNSDYIWVESFEPSAVKEFYEKFIKMEQDRLVTVIPVFIDSYGGAVLSMMPMRDIIKSSSKPVATICFGKAMSAGAALMAAGTPGYRFASPDSQFMIHEVSSFAMGKYSDLTTDVSWTKKLNKKMFINLSEDTGIEVSEFIKEMAKRKNTDWFLNASEAKRWGLIDYISVPKITIRSSVLEVVKTIQGKS